MKRSDFDWDDVKNAINKQKHGVSFEEAQYAFDDPKRVILEDIRIARWNGATIVSVG